jgi:hypothetical protein
VLRAANVQIGSRTISPDPVEALFCLRLVLGGMSLFPSQRDEDQENDQRQHLAHR